MFASFNRNSHFGRWSLYQRLALYQLEKKKKLHIINAFVLTLFMILLRAGTDFQIFNCNLHQIMRSF